MGATDDIWCRLVCTFTGSGFWLGMEIGTMSLIICRYGDHAPAEMESALRTASVVLVIVTRDFIRSRYCLEELNWAFEGQQRQAQPQHSSVGTSRAPIVAPLFYHDQDRAMGFGVDAFHETALRSLLWQRHWWTSTSIERTRWLRSLLLLKEQAGIRQDSAPRYAALDV